MAQTIPIAHDFVCPWCWIAVSQAKRLKRDFGIEVEWVGYELWPEELEWPTKAETRIVNPDRPAVPGRLALALAAEGIELPPSKRPQIRTHNAHEAVEFAKTLGFEKDLVDRLYRAYWVHGLDINNLTTIRLMATGLIRDLDELERAIVERRFASNITGFDNPAYEKGIFNVPTFVINGERFAEQPYSVLKGALGEGKAIEPVHFGVSFPAPPANRPYVVINMVATIDGKILTGERNENVMDLGSPQDHAAMRELQAAVDGVMLGAGSLRATKGLWYPKEKLRFVVTRSGDVDRKGRFFVDAPDKAFMIGSHGVQRSEEFQAGTAPIDLASALAFLKDQLGVNHLLVEGGSELNASLIEADLVDELFLTLAPKVKLGSDVPTYADGNPLPRDAVQKYDLVSERRVGDELFLRYRRKW